MYQLISASVMERGKAGDWQAANLLNEPMSIIARKYSNCILYLFDTVENKNVYADFFGFPSAAYTSPHTLGAYLRVANDIIGPMVLDELPEPEHVRFLFTNAYGMRTKPFNRNFDIDYPLMPDQEIDLLLYKDGIEDYQRIARNSLVTVGGFVHRMDANENGLVIYDGAKTAWKFGEARVGLLDFSKVGEIETIPVDSTMYRQPVENAPMRSSVYIDLKRPVLGKSIFVVLGGILHALDGFMDVVGESVVKLNFSQLDLMGIFYDTYEFIDYSSLPLTPDALNKDQWVSSEFETDVFVKAFLEHHQSFFVICETGNLSVTKRKLKNHEIPRLYHACTDTYPDYPVVVNRGFIAEYNIQSRKDGYCLTVPHYMRKHQFRTTVELDVSRIVRDTNYGPRAYSYSDAWALFIRKEI